MNAPEHPEGAPVTPAEPLSWTLDQGLYELVLHAPPCNEIGTAMLAALESFLDAVDLEAGRALIIRSALPGRFCAGADLRELYRELRREAEPARRRAAISGFLDRVHATFDRLDMLPMTTIAAISGLCFGGGFELALCCDLRVVEPDARFCFPELRLGLIPGFGGIPRLRREVGEGVIRDLVLSGRSLNARRATGLGLCSQLVGRGGSADAARRLARQLRKYPREATRTAKAFVKRLPEAELRAEKEHFLRLMGSPHVQEALADFVGRTDPLPYVI